MRSWPTAELLIGLGGGTLAALTMALLVLPRSTPAGSGRRRLCGLLFTATGLVLLPVVGPVPPVVVAGVVAVAVAAASTHARRRGFWSSVGATLPGSTLVALDGEFSGRIAVVVAVAVALVAPLAARSDATWRTSGTGPVLLAVSASGVFAAVPDTEGAAVLVGVALPLAAVSGALRPLWLGPVGAATAVTVLVWVAAHGGVSRPASVVGALCCLGLLVGGPVGAALGAGARAPRPPQRRLPGTMVVGWHLICVGVASRLAGLQQSLPPAMAWGVLSALAAITAGVVLGHAPDPRDGGVRR